jgi:hypothetical protein
MKSKDIINPSDLIVGDYFIIVTFEKLKATPAKIEKVAIDRIFEPTHCHAMYGLDENGLPREWDRKKWVVDGYYSGWDLRIAKWGEEYPDFYNKCIYKIFHLNQLEEAERFAKGEVPQRQLKAVLGRIDKIRNNFTNKMTEMQELERILQNNCNAVIK